MKKVLLSAACLMFSCGFALAADTATPTTTKPGEDAPTKTMDAATPTMKSPDDPNAQHPPAAAMDKAVPPMKAGDKPTDAGSSTTTTPKQ
jgi:hypothetical protein